MPLPKGSKKGKEAEVVCTNEEPIIIIIIVSISIRINKSKETIITKKLGIIINGITKKYVLSSHGKMKSFVSDKRKPNKQNWKK